MNRDGARDEKDSCGGMGKGLVMGWCSVIVMVVVMGMGMVMGVWVEEVSDGNATKKRGNRLAYDVAETERKRGSRRVNSWMSCAIRPS